MGDDHGDVICGEAGAGDGFHAGFAGVFHSGLEDFSAGHADSVQAAARIFWSDGYSAATSGHTEDVREPAIAGHDATEYGSSGRGVLWAGAYEDRGAGAVSKEDARVAVRPVDDAAELIRADDERGAAGAAIDEVAGDLHGIEEACAGGADVKGHGTRGS